MRGSKNEKIINRIYFHNDYPYYFFTVIRGGGSNSKMQLLHESAG